MMLNQHDIAILRALDERGGATTGWVAKRIAPVEIGCSRSNSQAVRQHLLHLEKIGLVGRLDDQKPVAWTRTPAGTAAIAPAPQKEAAA